MTEKNTNTENDINVESGTNTESATNIESEKPDETETGEANFSIVRYFKYVLILGILSFVALGALVNFLIWIFTD